MLFYAKITQFIIYSKQCFSRCSYHTGTTYEQSQQHRDNITQKLLQQYMAIILLFNLVIKKKLRLQLCLSLSLNLLGIYFYPILQKYTFVKNETNKQKPPNLSSEFYLEVSGSLAGHFDLKQIKCTFVNITDTAGILNTY